MSKYILPALAGAACAVLAACGSANTGWDPVMNCTERDLKSGLCIAATYSCPIGGQYVAYFVAGPRCYTRGEK